MSFPIDGNNNNNVDKNSAGANYGYPFAEDNIESYIFGDQQFLGSYNLDSGAPIAGPSGTQGWYPSNSPGGCIERCACRECTPCRGSGDQVVNPYGFSTGLHDTGMNIYDMNPEEAVTNAPPDFAGPAVEGMAGAPRHFSFNPPAPPPVTTICGRNTPPPILPRPNDYAAHIPTPSCPAETFEYGTYEQPLAGLSSASQWSYPYSTTSVDKGKARATDDFPSHPTSAGYGGEWDDRRPLPPTVPSVPPNASFPATDPSSGPQRSDGSAKGKRGVTQKGKGRWKPGPLPPGADSDWNKTMARLECELFEEYYIRPSGGSINPEMAFANIKRFIKEDSHRSPLVSRAVRAAATHRDSSLVYEQYLAHILAELRRPIGGETYNEKVMYSGLLQELESKLVPINDRSVLLKRLSKKKDLSDVIDSASAARRRTAENKRKWDIRGIQDQISSFFLVGGKKSWISVGDLLLFIVVYLKIGEHAFPGLIRPRSPGHGQ